MSIKHIHQKNIAAGRGDIEQPVYTVVVTEGFEEDLSLHPSVIDRPDLFEIVEGEIPTDRIVQYLKYKNDD